MGTPGWVSVGTGGTIRGREKGACIARPDRPSHGSPQAGTPCTSHAPQRQPLLTCQAKLWQHGVLIKRRPGILLPARPPLLIPPLVWLLVASRLGRLGCPLGFLGPG